LGRKSIPKRTNPTQNRDVCTASKGYCSLAVLHMTKYGKKKCCLFPVTKLGKRRRRKKKGGLRGFSLSCCTAR